MTLVSKPQLGEEPRLGEAGHPHTGASVPTTVVAPREDPRAGLTGETASGNSLVEGGEGVSGVGTKLPVNIVI